MGWDKPLVRQRAGIDDVCVWKVHGKYYLGVETSDYREEMTLDQLWDLAHALCSLVVEQSARRSSAGR